MIILSLDVWGVGGNLKKNALKRLITLSRPDVILLQETMCNGEKAVEFVKLWLKDWAFCSFDSKGLSGGLLSAWSPKLKTISSSLFPSGILLDLLDSDSSAFRISICTILVLTEFLSKLT